jgi:hypothetical protein
MSGVDVNVFGFQVKAYEKNSDDKRWQNAASIANQISQTFKNASTRTWSSNYAINYPIWYLSKFLINIINPVNIANITMGNIEYMNDFLSKYRLYMEVVWDYSTGRTASAMRGGGEEVVNPHVPTVQVLSSLSKQVGGTYRFQGFAPTGNMRNSQYMQVVNGSRQYVRVAGIRKI